MSNPTPVDARPRLAARVEAVFSLWRASLRPVYPFALLYSLSGVLPALTLGDLAAQVLGVVRELTAFVADPTGPLPQVEPSTLMDAVRAWLSLPSTWLALALAAAVALFGITGLMIRQHDVALGRDRGFTATVATTLARLPAALAAWLGYVAIMTAGTLVIGALGMVVSAYSIEMGVAGLLVMLFVFVVAAVLLSIPLAWASVAFAFAPVAATLDGTGPVAAHRLSARWVRGHWLRAATLITLPALVYLGVGSALSSFATMLALGTSYAAGGTAAMDSGGLAWMQAGMAFPMAAMLPLAFAGMIVGWEDLKDLNGIQGSG